MSTTTPIKELLNTQLSVESTETNKENYSNKQLINRKKMVDSPFEIITLYSEEDEKEYSFGVFGKYRITENKTYAEIEEYLNTFTWELLFKAMSLIIPEEMNRLLAMREDA